MSLVINFKADTGLVLRSENTTRFYKDIRKYDVMTREEEKEWFGLLAEAKSDLKSAIESNDKKRIEQMESLIKEIKDLIINSNQRLCVAAAKNWANTDNLMDYVAEANFGLMSAIDKFDYTKGVKFASYATWFIKREIEAYHHNTLPIVQKTNIAKTWSIISKARNEFMQENEREPSQDELLEIVNSKLTKGIKSKQDLTELYVSMIDDYGSGDNDDSVNHADIYDYNKASSTSNGYEEKEDDEYNKSVVSSLLDILPAREKKLIQMRFGLIEINGMKREFELKEVAEELGMTSERVRQLEASILKRLNKEYCERLASDI